MEVFGGKVTCCCLILRSDSLEQQQSPCRTRLAERLDIMPFPSDALKSLAFLVHQMAGPMMTMIVAPAIWWTRIADRCTMPPPCRAPGGNRQPKAYLRRRILHQQHSNYKARTPGVLQRWEGSDKAVVGEITANGYFQAVSCTTKSPRTLSVCCWHPCICHWHRWREIALAFPINKLLGWQQSNHQCPMTAWHLQATACPTKCSSSPSSACLVLYPLHWSHENTAVSAAQAHEEINCIFFQVDSSRLRLMYTLVCKWNGRAHSTQHKLRSWLNLAVISTGVVQISPCLFLASDAVDNIRTFNLLSRQPGCSSKSWQNAGQENNKWHSSNISTWSLS